MPLPVNSIAFNLLFAVPTLPLPVSKSVTAKVWILFPAVVILVTCAAAPKVKVAA
nr:hypothetical protein [Rickettsia sp. TH2014]